MVFPTPRALSAMTWAVQRALDRHTDAFMLPYVSFHSNSIVCMLSQKSEPNFNGFRMAIMYLNKTPQSDTLEILLALLVDKIAPGDCPAFGDPRQRYRAKRREV